LSRNGGLEDGVAVGEAKPRFHRGRDAAGEAPIAAFVDIPISDAGHGHQVVRLCGTSISTQQGWACAAYVADGGNSSCLKRRITQSRNSDRQIKALVDDIDKLVVGIDVQMQVGVGRDKITDNMDEAVCRKRNRGRHSQSATELTITAADSIGGIAKLGEDTASTLIELLSGIREVDLASAAVKQRSPELGLQITHAAADRGFRQLKTLGCGRKTAGVDDCDKGFQFLESHRELQNYAYAWSVFGCKPVRLRIHVALREGRPRACSPSTSLLSCAQTDLPLYEIKGVLTRFPYNIGRWPRMDYYKLPDIDLRRLVIFNEVMKRRSLTLVADELGLTQPAVSRALQRLRHEIGDALFVRTPLGMEPTPRALDIQEPVTRILTAYFNEIASQAPFDPATSKRIFTIQASDLGILIIIPMLVRELRKHASQMRIDAVTMSRKEVFSALESGDVDLSIGAYSVAPEGNIYQQRLFDQEYICLVRKDHPLAEKKALPLDVYLEQTHIIIRAGKTGHIHSMVESTLLEEIPAHNIAMTVPTFALAVQLLRDTDHIVTIPSAAAMTFGQAFGLCSLQCPLTLPQFTVFQHWHERFVHDPASKWLRGLIHEIFGGDALRSEMKADNTRRVRH